ncbi:Planctomycete cytochrome C [Chitinophaga sp. CF118]|uniref:c-type cytochrome domain-containing protein n=1 Tax=Chitinophaga sp. CF118 TaxID=1884367 RepID=UPI0008F10B66|nr:c-type cytochrome domain-containing protein [Chitinophaga sp. CF118]SFD01690.1 Planctomycete cytochrome C [Chitinophaga sp. CF118]
MRKVLLPMGAIIIVCNLMMMVSCSKSNETDLAKGTDTTGTGGTTCDTVNMKYAANVQPIISNYCYGCHGNGSAAGGISLDSYAKLKTQADNGNLLGTITHASGFAAMPLGGSKLSDCNINIIRDWINRGTQNN